MAGSSDEYEVPSNTCNWTKHLVDKFCIRKVPKNPIDLILNEWSLCSLNHDDISRINEIAKACSLPCIDCNSLDEVSFNYTMSYTEWVQEWFPKTTVKELKTFNENCEEFGFFLFDIIKQMELLKKNENQPPYEIEYQFLFEKFLRMFEIKSKGHPNIQEGRATIFGQEISSKADILCLKSDNPRKILCVCQVKRNGTPSEYVEYSPMRKKFHSSSSMSNEAASSSNSSFDLPFDLYAQHVGELLVYLNSSVMKKGLLGMIIHKTNVSFTFLKISQESYEKIRKSSKPESVKFDPAKEEEPILYYTEQFNYLKWSDRETLFKALLAIKLMDEAVQRP